AQSCHPAVTSLVLFYHFVCLQLYLKLLTAVYGGREQCVEILKKGSLLGVAPGGARESFFSDENYSILWGNRKGFAQVAIDAKVTKIAIEALRDRHQKLPGNILRALLERFDKYQKDD
uniref:Uncharacterized protein n=1 Tax=Chelonoidis abingdonii TaxID=106734 RepID=A0A8C0QQW2_CHEAB